MIRICIASFSSMGVKSAVFKTENKSEIENLKKSKAKLINSKLLVLTANA